MPANVGTILLPSPCSALLKTKRSAKNTYIEQLIVKYTFARYIVSSIFAGSVIFLPKNNFTEKSAADNINIPLITANATDIILPCLIPCLILGISPAP